MSKHSFCTPFLGCKHQQNTTAAILLVNVRGRTFPHKNSCFANLSGTFALQEGVTE